MPHVNNLNFLGYVFSLSFLHALEDNLGKRKQHKMKKKLSIPRK